MHAARCACWEFQIATDDSLQADQFLVDEIRRGSESAWRQLIERYQGRLLAFARSRLSRGPDADDAVQEAFVGLLQSLPHYDGSRSLETYLFAIVRHKILDVCRQRNVKPTVSFDQERDLGDSQMLGPATGETPSGVLHHKEATAAQRRALAQGLRAVIAYLREQTKLGDLKVIELIFFAGRRNKEVAAALDMDEKAVAGVKFRAIGRLRQILEETPGAASLFDRIDEVTMDTTVASVWQDQRLTCLKRSTLGAFQLGVLDDAWDDYIQFHLETLQCPYCTANLDDLRSEAHEQPRRDYRERVFASSVGFLSRPSSPR